MCPCGISQETLAHVVAYCLREDASRRGLLFAHQSCLPGVVVHEEEEDMGVQGSAAERRKRRPGDYPSAYLYIALPFFFPFPVPPPPFFLTNTRG